MEMCNCNCRFSCTVLAVISAVVVGVVAAFLQILGTITVGTAFLWVALGIGVVCLAGLLVAALLGRETTRPCACGRLTTLLLAVLGTILLALILLAVGIVATSVLSAVGVGLLLFFLWLTFAESACYIRCVSGCA